MHQLNNAVIVVDTTIEGGFDSNQTRFDKVDKRFDSSI